MIEPYSNNFGQALEPRTFEEYLHFECSINFCHFITNWQWHLLPQKSMGLLFDYMLAFVGHLYCWLSRINWWFHNAGVAGFGAYYRIIDDDSESHQSTYLSGCWIRWTISQTFIPDFHAQLWIFTYSVKDRDRDLIDLTFWYHSFRFQPFVV